MKIEGMIEMKSHCSNCGGELSKSGTCHNCLINYSSFQQLADKKRKEDYPIKEHIKQTLELLEELE